MEAPPFSFFFLLEYCNGVAASQPGKPLNDGFQPFVSADGQTNKFDYTILYILYFFTSRDLHTAFIYRGRKL